MRYWLVLLLFIGTPAIAENKEDPVDKMLKQFEIREENSDRSGEHWLQEQENLEEEIRKFRRENVMHHYKLEFLIVDSEVLTKTFGAIGDVANRKKTNTSKIKKIAKNKISWGPEFKIQSAAQKKETLRSYTLGLSKNFIEENK